MPTDPQVGVVVVAAGSSARMAGVDKTFAPLLGRPLITHTLARFEEFPAVAEIVLVLAASSMDLGRRLVQERGYTKVSQVCAGGARRQDSVKAGLDALQPCDFVMVHDGARPGLDAALLQRGLDAVTVPGCAAAIAGVPVKDTIKVVTPDGHITDTPDRSTLWAAQTPQIFAHDLLREAHAQFTQAAGVEATDDAMMVEALGYPVNVFLGSYENLKVTTPEDLAVMEAILRGRAD